MTKEVTKTKRMNQKRRKRRRRIKSTLGKMDPCRTVTQFTTTTTARRSEEQTGRKEGLVSLNESSARDAWKMKRGCRWSERGQVFPKN